MLAAERRRRIADTVDQVRFIATDELADQLGVSPETIRRDFIALEKRGLLRRVHGGVGSASATATGEEAAFSSRIASNSDAKASIASAAIGLIEKNHTVFIDVGTTVLTVARAFPRDFSGTVFTNSLYAAAELADRTRAEVFVSGGRLRPGDLTMSNAAAGTFLEGVYPDVALLGSGGLDEVAGVTDYHYDEAVLRKGVIRNARQSFVLADSSKFGRVALNKVADFSQITGIVTDAAPPSALARAIEAGGAQLLIGG